MVPEIRKIMQFCHYKDLKKQKNCIFRALRLSEGYTYLKPPITNQVLLSFCRVNKLPSASGSQDIGFGQFWDFPTQFWLKKWVLPTFYPDHYGNPRTKPSKDPKTAPASEFTILGRSPTMLDWSICF